MNKKSFIVKSIDVKEIDAMASVHVDAFSENLMTKLGSIVVKRYYLWQFTDIEKYNKKIHSIGVFDNNELVAFTIFGIPRNAKIGFLRKNFLILSFMAIINFHKYSFSDFKDVLKNISYLTRKILFFFKKQKEPNISTKKDSYGILVTACKRDYEGRGFGTLLMRNAEKIVKEHSTSLSLSVRESNTNAWKIYEVLGYEKVKDVNGNWIGRKMIKNFK